VESQVNVSDVARLMKADIDSVKLVELPANKFSDKVNAINSDRLGLLNLRSSTIAK